MSAKLVTVTLFTCDHVFHGNLQTGGRRLQEVLNETLTDFLQLTDLKIHDVATDSCVTSVASGLVRKAEINLAIMQEAAHEAPEKRQYSFVMKNVFPVFLVAGGFEVQGRLHIQHSPDPLAYLARDAKYFFPVTQPTITYPTVAKTTVIASVVLVQKSTVSVFHLDNR